jgi:predicted nuclease of predicted toxin-antitoxin system
VKILIDMNLPPAWTEVFRAAGWDAVHWSAVGDPGAPDGLIMDWARSNGHVVFTHDLDFGTLLAATQAQEPRVIQVRAQNVMPEHLGVLVVATLRRYDTLLESGALIVVDEARSRVRVLPLPR